MIQFKVFSWYGEFGFPTYILNVVQFILLIEAGLLSGKKLNVEIMNCIEKFYGIIFRKSFAFASPFTALEIVTFREFYEFD